MENEGNRWAQPVMRPWTPIQACRVQVTPLWLPQDAAALDSRASDKVPGDLLCVPGHASEVDRAICPCSKWSQT